ncbi:MAG: ABC transporter permease [Phycisphaerales bacterium]|nr:ABC transporter permease [Phycisphaerales bacterium]
MAVAITIARRELASYFYSPVAYVAMTLFLLTCGILFWNDFRPGQPVAMRTLFEWMVWLLVFVVPVLCMGLLAQEWSSGTFETLMTAPLTETDVVIGKFLGAFSFFLFLLSPTLLYVALLGLYGRLDFGPVVSGYLGILLVGGLFAAVGLFCSSVTRSQVVAAVLAATVLFVVTIVPWWVTTRTALGGFWRKVADQCVFARYTDFSKGVIDLGHVVFFAAATCVFLFLTVKVVESQRWK